MAEKILLHLLLLCGILCSEIIATLSDDGNQESSTLLAREKRVVNLGSTGHEPVRIDFVNYMAMIKYLNRAHCTGVILSHYTIITAATCVLFDESQYQIHTGSGYTHLSVNHTVTSKVIHNGNPPHDEIFDGIALLTVDPPFIFGSKIGSIQLYTGPLTAGTQATVSGWGCYYPLMPVRGMHRRLRRITLPIMDHGECQNVYRSNFTITHKYICTYHIHKYCAYTDLGAPLVVNNMLAGIHVFKGEFPERINPDVFIDLQLPEYREWIRQNTLLM